MFLHAVKKATKTEGVLDLGDAGLGLFDAFFASLSMIMVTEVRLKMIIQLGVGYFSVKCWGLYRFCEQCEWMFLPLCCLFPLDWRWDVYNCGSYGNAASKVHCSVWCTGCTCCYDSKISNQMTLIYPFFAMENDETEMKVLARNLSLSFLYN